MNKARVSILASMALLMAACSSTPPSPSPPPAVTPAATPVVPDLNGHWVLTTHSRMGHEDADMMVHQAGNALAGTLTSSNGKIDYTGTIQGNAVAFSLTLKALGNSSLKIDYAGTVQGDTMQGKAMFGSFGEGTFSARRKGS